MNEMNWFRKLVGFEEENPNQVRYNLIFDDGLLYSKKNGTTYQVGELEIPTLDEIKSRVKKVSLDKNKVQEIVADIKTIHCLSENDGSLIQAASQFNLLEMSNPNITPEQGVAIYEYDLTQGPACAISCGAGTIYRNYFVQLNGQVGQDINNQIDCLSEIFLSLNKEYFQIQNGYAFVTESDLEDIEVRINSMNNDEYESLKGLLKVGIQKDTQVTIMEGFQKVTQVYCSALPVGYSDIPTKKWESFAKLILDGLYEATLLSAIENRERTGNNKVFLTLVGGGVFGNDPEWIIDAVIKNLKKYEFSGLEINFVSYAESNSIVRKIIKMLK